MGKHNINISIVNTPLGVPTSSDGVMMIVSHAAAIGSTFALDTAYLLTKLEDLATLGITAATDTSNGVALYQQASEFYDEAGDGAKLWLVGVAKATAMSTYVASDGFKNLVRGTTQADNANRCKMIGICYKVPTATQVATDFDSDVDACLTALQTTQTTLFAEGYQFSFIIDGTNMSATITPATLTTLVTKAKYSGSVCITGTKANGVSAVGLALGRFARISVGHGFGAVEDGAVGTSTAYLTNGNLNLLTSSDTLIVGVTYLVSVDAITYNSVSYAIGSTFTAVQGHTSFTGSGKVNAVATNVAKLFPADIDNLGEKQFMFLRQWFNHSGYYWNDGATAGDTSKPLSTQEFNRVANKMAADALSFMIDTVGKNVPIDTKTGLVDAGYTGTLQSAFYDSYIKPLKVSGGTGDITDGSITISGTPNGTRVDWTFAIVIVPTPFVGGATGTIQFSYTL